LYWKKTGISERFIQELQIYCGRNENIEKVILFGSRARGDHRKTSDIDLALYTNHLSHSEQSLIEADILDMSTPLKMDILFQNRLNKEKLILNIKREGVIVYDGVIQRFEFTFELSWKLMKMFLEYTGIEELKSPRATIREAYA
jgi:predicted nucleotidyltransferase